MTGKIDKINWPDQFPYKPEVQFSIKADGSLLHIDFKVREEQTIARASHNFDEVWKDSCCELFIMFEGDDKYYNLETSCNGYQIFACRTDRHNSEPASEEIMAKIKCITSLEKGKTFGPQHIDEWSLSIQVPAEAFWCSNLKDFKNVKAKGNIYKCVEHLPKMHFVSWAAIDTPAPDFHRPEFFKPLSL